MSWRTVQTGIHGGSDMATMAAEERFDMGRVVGRAAGAVQRNLVLFAILALLLQAAPALVLRAVVPATPVVPGTLPSFGPFYFIALLVTLALYYVLQVAVTHVTVVDLKNEKPTLGPALTRGFRLILPLIGLGIVSGLGIMVGFIFLIVPGIILALMWSVAVPAMVEERLGIIASLGRSRALTKGSRGSIFLMGLAMFILALLVVGTIGLMTTGVDVASMMANAEAAANRSFGFIDIFGMLLNAVLVIFFTALIAAIYVELRYVKDGVEPQNLAAIFD